MLRTILDQAWNQHITEVVQNLNNSPNKGVGYLIPATLHGILADSSIRSALQTHNLSKPPEPSYTEQIQLEKDYLDSSNVLLPGDYVLLNLRDEPFFKSYDQQVSKKSMESIYSNFPEGQEIISSH